MNNSHSAKYLILIGPRTARRALLFNHEHEYLSEVIDDRDGLIVDELLQSASACELPCGVKLEGIVPAAQLASASVRCLDLGEAKTATRTLETIEGSGA